MCDELYSLVLNNRFGVSLVTFDMNATFAWQRGQYSALWKYWLYRDYLQRGEGVPIWRNTEIGLIFLRNLDILNSCWRISENRTIFRHGNFMFLMREGFVGGCTPRFTKFFDF